MTTMTLHNAFRLVRTAARYGNIVPGTATSEAVLVLAEAGYDLHPLGGADGRFGIFYEGRQMADVDRPLY